MSQLKEKIQSDIKEAMKAQNKERLLALRLLFSQIRKEEIDTRKDVDDSQVEKIIQKAVKQVNESLEQAQQASRDDLSAEASAQLKVFKEYLPEEMSAAELKSKLKEIYDRLSSSGNLPEGAKAMGPMMGAARSEIGARAQAKDIQVSVRELLGL